MQQIRDLVNDPVRHAEYCASMERKTGKRISAASKETINTARTHMKSADDLLIALTNDEADDDGEDSGDDTSGEKAAIIAATEPAIDHSAAQSLIESMRSLIPAA